MPSKRFSSFSIRVWRAKRTRWALLLLGFGLLSVWSIWPAPRTLCTGLPTGPRDPGTVPMFNAWTIWWNADRLTHGLRGYWDAPIFHPEKGTFAFSEPQPATWSVAPIVWYTGSPVLAYHAYLLGTLVLNALFGVRLLRALRVQWWLAASGGIAILLLPLVHQNREALQLMSVWGVLWTLEWLVHHHRRPSLKRGFLLGIAFASVFYSCIHHGVFLALLLAWTAWITYSRRDWKRWWAGCTVAGVTATVLLLPILIPMRRELHKHEFSRPVKKVQSLSAKPPDWMQTVPRGVTGRIAFGARSSRPLLPGWIRAAFAVVAVLFVVGRRTNRRLVLFLTAFGLTAVVWSFGMNLSIGDWHPWRTLADCVPGFSQVRSVYRFAYFAQLTIILLGTMGLDRLSRWRKLRARSLFMRLVGTGLFAILCLLFAFEVPPVSVRVVRVPDVTADAPWIEFLRKNTPSGQAIVCLPFADGYSTRGSECTGRWMLLATRHQLPMVNGYSGFFPKPWYGLVKALNEERIAEATLWQLADLGVEFLVIDRQMRGPIPELPSDASSIHVRVVPVFWVASNVEIYRLVRADPSGG